MFGMRRREFVSLFGGAAVAWPVTAWAQQPQRMRRIGVLDTLAGDDPEASVRHGAFMQGLQELGWGIGRNVRIDTRWAAGDPGRIRNLAVEIVATGPDVIFTSGFSTIRPLLDATSTLPIVFANVVDPVGAGFVASLARPGGNVTGFASYEFGFPIKWLELLKQIAPGVTRAAVLRDPTISALIGQFAAIQGAAPSFGVEVMPIDVRDGDELQRAVAGFLRGPNDGLIVLGGPRSNAQRGLIAAMIAGHRIPAVYAARYFVTAGGLISYGPDFVDQYRRAAGYVDRILKGTRPSDLPVQAPTKHELVINLKTAKALGIDMPEVAARPRRRGDRMRRRQFITLLGGAAAWPLAAYAQQPQRIPQIGVLMGVAESDPGGQTRIAAFRQGLADLGWAVGRNIHLEYRWAAGDIDRTRAYAAELVALAPEVLVGNGTPALTALRDATRSIPIVFVVVNDPVGQGFIANLARPGGNITGFSFLEYSMVGKSLELLKQLAPSTHRFAVMFNPETTPHYTVFLRSFETVPPPRPLEIKATPIGTEADIEQAVAQIAREPGGGLIVPPDTFTVVHRGLIIRTAAQHRVPAIFSYRQFVREGALIAYGPDTTDIFQRSASYVDRILKGANPGDLPVQAPNKFELAINVNTARRLGLDLPPTLLGLADEVIE